MIRAGPRFCASTIGLRMSPTSFSVALLVGSLLSQVKGVALICANSEVFTPVGKKVAPFVNAKATSAPPHCLMRLARHVGSQGLPVLIQWTWLMSSVGSLPRLPLAKL